MIINEKMVKFVAVLLLMLLTITGQAKAQGTYNRWDARPVATPQPSRVSQPDRSKAQQDSVRRAAYWDKQPPLKRGIGPRIRSKQLQPEDQPYSDFVMRSVRYPLVALRAQTEGEVWMRLSVDATGRVIRVTPLDTTVPSGAGGEAEMVQQTRQILRHLRFEPAAVATEEEAVISFRIL